MDSVSGIGLYSRGKSAVPSLNSGAYQFSKEIMLAKADALLRRTAQYPNWHRLRQRDDELAVKMADALLRRHELLEDAGQGRVVDWQLFDRLTDQLKTNNIHLFKRSQLSGFELSGGNPVPDSAVSPNLSESKKATPASPISAGKKGGGPIKTKGVESASSLVSDETLVLLNVEYKNYILNDSLIGYGDSNKIFLPLSEMSRTLDFSIDVNAKKGTARGWFISEDRAFSLDMSKMQVISDGDTLAIPNGGVEAANGELYVDSALLSKWFPVDYTYDFSNQSVGIDPREKLPFQKRIERERGWQNLGAAGTEGVQFPKKQSEYDLLSVPFVDLGMTGSYIDGKTDDDRFRSTYYMNAKGDLGKMNTEVYLSGDHEDGLDTSRLTLRRKDPDAQLLGPLKATGVAVGDIRTASFPIIGGGETERGVGLTNEKLFRSKEFDTTYFEGNLPPGWDVEVYRNNTLVDTMRVGADGRYRFDDIPVYYGKNDFKLMFYGPQGQERVETKQINVGSELIEKGVGEYQVSLSQKDTELYDPDETETRPEDGSLKMNARYAYGVDNDLSIVGGLSTQEVDEERHNYLNLGAKAIFDTFYVSGEYLHDTKGGNAVEMFTQTELGGFDLRVKQSFYEDFIDDDGADADPLKRQTEISAAGRIPGNDAVPDLPFTLSYGDTRREDSRSERLTGRLSATIKKINFNNSLQWDRNSGSSDESSSLSGDFQATTQLGDFRVRGRMDYEIDPDPEVESLEFSSFLNLGDRLSTEWFLKKDLEVGNDLYSSLRLNWNNGKFNISPQVSYNINGEWGAFLGFSTSLGREPRHGKTIASSARLADSGAVSVKVYHDKNQNHVFDEGDETIPGASINAVHAYKKAETDENGVAFLTGLQKHKPTDIVIDKNTLDDPFWEPVEEGRSIVPRPGHVATIDIPVVTTGEIDGFLLTRNKEGVEVPLANVNIQLLDSEGNIAQETRSEYDGYYYFNKILPGNYSVGIHPGKLEELGLAGLPVNVEIDPQGTAAGGSDIFLKTEFPVAEQTPPGPGGEKSVRRPEPAAPAGKPSEILTDPLKPEPSVLESRGAEKFGLHLTSYRTPEKAAAGINYLIQKYKDILGDADFTIKKVEVSDEKGTWYRVIAGSFVGREKLEQMKKRIKMALPYAGIVSLNSGNVREKGVHLTSFRTRNKAEQSIGELKQQYPSLLKNIEFTIQDVDLGSKMGRWKRVVAGRYSNDADARQLAEKIKLSAPYCRPVEIEKENEFGIHIASYRTPGKAAGGLKPLQDKYGAVMENMNLSVRRVDLGAEKGVWYRIFAGNFESRAAAAPLKQSFDEAGQYAEIRPF